MERGFRRIFGACFSKTCSAGRDAMYALPDKKTTYREEKTAKTTKTCDTPHSRRRAYHAMPITSRMAVNESWSASGSGRNDSTVSRASGSTR